MRVLETTRMSARRLRSRLRRGRHWVVRHALSLGDAARTAPADLQVLEHRVAAKPGNRRARLDLSRALARLGHVAAAIETLRPALVRYPRDRRILLRLGTLLARDGQLAEAEEQLEAVLAAGQTDWRVYAELASVQQKLGKNADAQVNILTADRLANGPSVWLAQLLDGLDQSDRALARLRLAPEDEQRQPPNRIWESRQLDRLARPEAAAEILNGAVRDHPANSELRFGLARQSAEAGLWRVCCAAQIDALRVAASESGLCLSGLAEQGQVTAALENPARAEAYSRPLRFRLFSHLRAHNLADELLGVVGDAAPGIDPSGPQPFQVTPVFGPDRLEGPLARTDRLLSVMIPVYNVSNPKWLSAGIETVLAQAPGPDQAEIIMVDDGSTDPTAREIAARFAPRLTYRRNANNLGLVGNHNHCLASARGEFVHVFHQDDEIAPGFYDALLPSLSRDSSLSAATCRSWYMDEAGSRVYPYSRLRADPGPAERLVERFSLTQRFEFSSVISRRSAAEAVGGFSRALVYGFDWDMWSKLAAHGPVWYHPDTLGGLRVHSRSATYGIEVFDRVRDLVCVGYRVATRLPPEHRRAALITNLGHYLHHWWHWSSRATDTSQSDARDRVIGFLTEGWADDDVRTWAIGSLGSQ